MNKKLSSNDFFSKKVNPAFIVFAVVAFSMMSSIFESFGMVPFDMTKAMLNGNLYTNILSEERDEYGNLNKGIVVIDADGNEFFLPAYRIGDLTEKGFEGTEVSVFLDDKGNTFWLTYEDLGIVFVSLLLTFFLMRYIFLLALFILSKVNVFDDVVYMRLQSCVKLFLRPLRMMFFIFILLMFYQYRVFSDEEEKDVFTKVMYGYMILTFGILVFRVTKLRKLTLEGQGASDSTHVTSKNKATGDRDVVVSVSEKGNGINNDLIKREKVKYKHATSRYNK
ncbi:hypothetical protein VSO92_02280 [Myroides pelagicus]|uniref:hypothetical protein n=1 Tax=Myroides pelagicus TaxID=270914 RepID=UPI002DC00955|nr:hypothetical protein [Myroides pelagicus]MEC4112937.1 hypothetical protein [Myroides pelagicus]